METQRTPHIVPMYLTGFDKLLPVDRPFPSKFVPQAGQHLSVTFGSPMTIVQGLDEALRSWREQRNESKEEVDRTRSRVTKIVQNEVEALGRVVEAQLSGS